jgi:hypothetical protein
MLYHLLEGVNPHEVFDIQMHAWNFEEVTA